MDPCDLEVRGRVGREGGRVGRGRGRGRVGRDRGKGGEGDGVEGRSWRGGG